VTSDFSLFLDKISNRLIISAESASAIGFHHRTVFAMGNIGRQNSFSTVNTT
jgi:hypothetical protein